MTAVQNLGFSTLFDPDNPQLELQSSIVFVHGLQGHPKDTWTYNKQHVSESVEQQSAKKPSRVIKRLLGIKKKENEPNSSGTKDVFWPRDLLVNENETQKARIMTYGYDSHVTTFFEANNHDNISKQAESFMVPLQQAREENAQRPLILVAHGLGGIIIKGALEESKRSEHRPQFLSIYNSLRGIIFLGTPHGGSTMADWGLIATGIVKFTSQGCNSKALKGFQPDSEILEFYRKCFLKMLQDQRFTIHSFYEKRGTSGILGFQGKAGHSPRTLL
ncbi:P-loop containing nucleoside triphosphate hydrolase [Penicillium angulare]|uniref:P-loop containing nucleoside triphosphate hydrolase n=1 Tax=Penicillium angulare TaxID=116970 RepID=A0A9W9FHM4_9EURO|nr:P-loop containing nucleoside triphosphate hydrolase [Penicillium angulare]